MTLQDPWLQQFEKEAFLVKNPDGAESYNSEHIYLWGGKWKILSLFSW